MGFDVPAESYDRFMGRFSRPLAVELADAVELASGMRVLDVGCGPGALSEELAARLGSAAVTAVDPMAGFVAAARERLPGARVLQAAAEHLPSPDDTYDRTLAQLVVHFMDDPVAGLAEMARVTRAGGLVAATVWDHTGDRGPLSLFWRAVHDLDPTAGDEAGRAGVQQGDLARLFVQAGLRPTTDDALTVVIRLDDFQQWWEPFEFGIGPAGEHVAGLDDAGRLALRGHLAELLPAGPFEVSASAWFVAARV